MREMFRKWCLNSRWKRNQEAAAWRQKISENVFQQRRECGVFYLQLRCFLFVTSEKFAFVKLVLEGPATKRIRPRQTNVSFARIYERVRISLSLCDIKRQPLSSHLDTQRLPAIGTSTRLNISKWTERNKVIFSSKFVTDPASCIQFPICASEQHWRNSIQTKSWFAWPAKATDKYAFLLRVSLQWYFTTKLMGINRTATMRQNKTKQNHCDAFPHLATSSKSFTAFLTSASSWSLPV